MVRVIGADGEQIGVISTDDALRRAEAADLDLVEVSPNAEPPVCKILDYGKFKFQEQKRASEARKKQQVVTVKEMAIRPRTEEHDYQIKLRKIRGFLEDGNKAKINLRFKGREVTHSDIGKEMLDRLQADTADISRVENRSGLEGRFMNMVLAPDKSAKKKAEAEAARAAAAAAKAEQDAPTEE